VGGRDGGGGEGWGWGGGMGVGGRDGGGGGGAGSRFYCGGGGGGATCSAMADIPSHDRPALTNSTYLRNQVGRGRGRDEKIRFRVQF
jgi:hypothetical protein